MKFNILLALATSGILSACGGGGGGGSTATTPAGDTTAPVVTAAQSFSYAENQIANATVATVLATDNVGVTGFKFASTGTSSSADGYYTIDNTGQVKITAAGVAAGVAQNDFETAPNSFTYSVQATDATGNASVAANVVFNVTNVEEVPPVVTAVNQTLTAGSTVTLTATATDNVAVTGYCFKTESTTPLAADACFQASAQKTGLSLAKNLTHYVWAKDAAGNISAASTGSCSAAGFTASNASTKKVVCMLTDKGQVVLELDATKAPITVANFLSYTNAGFYGNTTFHRVISNFMVQGGGFTYANGAYSQKTTSAPIVLEKTSTTGLSNLRGTIAMARTSVANSATSQFFINVVDNAFLDAAGQSDGNGYAVFGKVIAGMDVVDAIKGVTTGTVSGMADAPTTPVYVQWAYQVQ